MSDAAELIRAIGSLWPLVLIGAALWWRRSLANLLRTGWEELRNRNVERVRFGPFEIAWRGLAETVTSIETEATASLAPGIGESGRIGLTPLVERLDEWATVAPVAAILDAHTEIEDAL